MTISDTTMLTRTDTVLATELGDEYVMMDIESGEYFSLSGVAARIWELVETSKTLAEICAKLETEYDVDAATCRADVTEFVQNLVSAKIVISG